MNACLEEKYKVGKMEYTEEKGLIEISPRNIRHGDVIITIFNLEGEIVILPQKKTKNGIAKKFAEKIKENYIYPIHPYYTIAVN